MHLEKNFKYTKKKLKQHLQNINYKTSFKTTQSILCSYIDQ